MLEASCVLYFQDVYEVGAGVGFEGLERCDEADGVLQFACGCECVTYRMPAIPTSRGDRVRMCEKQYDRQLKGEEAPTLKWNERQKCSEVSINISTSRRRWTGMHFE